MAKGKSQAKATHPGLIRRRGKGWNVALRVAGDRHEYGPKRNPELIGASRADVEEFVWREYKRLMEDSKRQNRRHSRAGAISELFTAYEIDKLPEVAPNTARTYWLALERFRDFFVEELGDPRADRIGAPDVRQYLSWRRRRDKVGLRTLAKDRAMLSGIFSYALRELEVVDANPVARVKPPKPDPRTPIILDADQLETLIAECAENPMLRMFVILCADTGARSQSEILHLRWEDLDLDGGFLHIATGRHGHRTKSGKSRWVPLTPRSRHALREHMLRFRGRLYDGAQSPWVFHHPYARRRAKAGSRIATMLRGFQAAALRAKLPDGVHVHDLRHMRITSWLAQGANAVHVKEAVGHADLRTTMAYTHLVREHLRVLVDPDPQAKPHGAQAE